VWLEEQVQENTGLEKINQLALLAGQMLNQNNSWN